MGGDVEGLLILPEEAQVGQPFAQHLGRSGTDVVYDLEVTPNRPDLNSVIGIAREISALTGNPVRLPEVVQVASENDSSHVEELVKVRLDDPELCPRYTARVVRGVKIGPSPDWLRSTLEKVGIRSISNVVDVTNYVMMETGQPLHAFDYHLLTRAPGATVPAIVVRRAAEGEKFTTLDGQERQLTSNMLLIADETKAVALAGVMGGLNSEIQPTTTDVLIESAWFKPQNIRATSKKLELRTESSYRFEREADIGISDWASRRAALLILQTAGGTLASGVVDAYPQPRTQKQLKLRYHKVTELLGVDLSPEQIDGYLSQLELRPVSRKPRPVPGEEAPQLSTLNSQPAGNTFVIPTWRVDLKREIDLIEEVARLYGVDRIPATPPRGAVGSNPYDSVQDIYAEARRILTGIGLFEAQGQTLISDTAARLAATGDPFPLANPLSSDMNVLRPSLIPGLLDALRHNLSRKNDDVALFELGRVFLPPDGKETRRIAIALTGNRYPLYWSGPEREAKFDIYDLKGILEEFLEQFGIRGTAWQRLEQSSTLFIESASIQLGRLRLGELGQLTPLLAKKYDLRDPVLLAELDLDQLLARRNPGRQFRQLPAFPSIRRDVALLVPEATTHEAVQSVIRQTKPAHLESVELFDVFRGKNVAAGQKSMAYALTYRHPERTLTDAEVNAAQEKLIGQLKDRLKATVRE